MSIHLFKKYLLRGAVLLLPLAVFLLFTTASCRVKYGCPSDGKNVGAERLMSGEKLPRAPKFKS